MKTLYTNLSLMAVVLFMLSGSLLFSQTTIHSTSAGGPWDSTWTWVEGWVPTSNIDVVINGAVYTSNDACHNLTINPGGVLSHMSWHYTLDVGGDVVNNGVITQNGYNLTLNIAGDIVNNGTWDNSYTHLTGTDIHYLSCMNGHSFSGYRFDNASTGNVILAGDTYFDNVQVEMNNTQISIPASTQLKLHGGYLYQCSLIAGGNNSVVFGAGTNDNDSPYFQFVNFTDMEMLGTIRIHSDCYSYGTLTNNGRIINANWYYAFSIKGDFINNGLLENPTYNFDINLEGNFINNGTTDLHAINFYGTANQEITELNGHTFTPNNFISYKPSGKLIALTDLDFNNCIFDMQDDTIVLQDNGKLKLYKGQLNNSVIVATTAGEPVQLEMDANSYIANCEVYNPNIQNRIRIYGNDNVFYGNTVVTDTLDNYGWYYILTTYGNFVNNGVVQDDTYDLDLQVYGDVTNNGFFVNKAISLYGASNQEITELNGHTFTPLYFTSYKPSGKLIALTDLDFSNCILNMQEDTIVLQDNGKLKINQGEINNSVIVANTAGQPIQLEMDANSYIYNCEVYNPEILDRVRIYGNDNVFYGNTVVTDTLDNYGWYYLLPIKGDLFNNGIIQDDSYDLQLNIEHNIVNNGKWENNLTSLAGTTDQHITSLNNHTFNGYKFENSNTGNVYFDGKNIFDNVRMEFHNNKLILNENDSIIIRKAYLYECQIIGDTTSVVYGANENDAPYFESVQFHNVSLAGTIVIYGNSCSSYGLLTNNAVLQNYGWYYAFNIHGDIINNNTIKNPSYTFTLNIDGNITNNGSWTNSNTYLTGTADQTVSIENGQIIQCHLNFVSDIQTEPYQWVWNGSPINSSSPFFSGEDWSTLTIDAALTNYYNGIYYCVTGGGNSRNIIVNDPSNQVIIYAMIEGAFNGANMNTTLNTKGLIPLNQPFNKAPWNYSGHESVAGIPNGDIVDWVLVEFRDAADAQSATSGTVISRKAGFLLKTGQIVDVDGGSRLSFAGTVTQNLFAVVYHRNHLAVMSANPLTFGSYYYYYQFNTAVSQAYQSGQKEINGTAVMYGGDANADGTIDINDGIDNWNQEVGQAGYLSSDADLNGQSDNKDKNDIWLGNTGISTTVPN